MKKRFFVLLYLAWGCLFSLGGTTLQEMYDQAEPGAGYDRLVILESGTEYTGGLKLMHRMVYEDFESATFPPEGWAVYDCSGSTSWSQDGQNAYMGNQCAAHPNSTSASESWLVMPQITITEPCSLLFYRYNTNITWFPSFGVWISTGSGDPADNEFELLQSFQTVTGWTFSTADLSAYEGSDVYIAFHYMATNYPAWHIDEVSIGNVPTDEKTKIIGNGAIVNLQNHSIEVESSNVLDIDGLVVIEGNSATLNYRNSSFGYISNSTFYGNFTAIVQQTTEDVSVECKNVILANNIVWGFLRSAENTSYLSYMCAHDNSQGHYIYKVGC